MTVHALDQALLIGAAVLLVAVVAVRAASRTGLPSLLLYLGIGLLLGADGLGIRFSNAALAEVLGYAALVLILAEGGLTTRWSTIRSAVPPAISLAVVGVGVSVAITGVAAHLLLGLDARRALLLGAIVSPTDAAAVFSVLRRLPLPRRLTGVLEAESGFNDAPVVILVVTFGGALTAPGPWHVILGSILAELAIGALVGLAIGRIGAITLRRVALPVSGLYPIAVLAFAVLAYAAGALLHGSGFLAVYLAALILGNSALPHRLASRGFAEGLAWLAQIGLFILLGLLATPSALAGQVLPAIAVGAVLLLVARPVSVLASTLPFRLPGRLRFPISWREHLFLSWAGLRGAVPIVLATIPIVGSVRGGEALFNTVFVLVAVFTLIQGPTLPWVAKALGVTSPADTTELEVESAPLERLRSNLLEVRVPAGSRLHGVEVRELRLPYGASVVLVVRAGKSLVPSLDTMLLREDELLVVTPAAVLERTEARLRAVSRRGRLAGWFGEHGT